jgi:signal transduction histidine kinase
MRRVSFSFFIAFITIACLTITPALAEPPKYEHKETKELVALVDAAATLVAREGEDAINSFRLKGGKWLKGNRYIFVTAPDGLEVVNPVDPQLEGKNLYELRDAMGKLFVKQFIKRAMDPKGPGWTWSHYLWHKPGKILLTWKTSYIKRVKTPDGKFYLVGSGLYGMKMERAFVVDKVDRAAALIEEQGEKAFVEIRRRDSEFVFNDTYVFVDNMQGVELVNPMFPGIEGKNILNLNNEEGRQIVKEYINLVKKKGSGWIGYYWPKPGQTKPAIKHTYVRGVKHGGKQYVVGCGVYLD